MGNISLLQHEHEVERSRAKLTQDLAVLCSPKTLAAFTDDLKQEAFATRDDFWEKIKARSRLKPGGRSRDRGWAGLAAIPKAPDYERLDWTRAFQLVEDATENRLRRHWQAARLHGAK